MRVESHLARERIGLSCIFHIQRYISMLPIAIPGRRARLCNPVSKFRRDPRSSDNGATRATRRLRLIFSIYPTYPPPYPSCRPTDEICRTSRARADLKAPEKNSPFLRLPEARYIDTAKWIVNKAPEASSNISLACTWRSCPGCES